RRQADQGELATAAAACHAVLASEPDSADAYFILGMVSECEKKIGVADDYWRRCVYLQPDHYEALCHLALLTEQAGDAAQAAALKQRAARIYQRQQHGSSGKTSP
ncbi:MAG: methyltransferase, partial [Telluria sp.]